jgi:hypothetical protein
MTTLATKLSVFAALAFAVSACTVSSSDNNTSDASTPTDGGGTKDTGTTSDSSSTTDTGTGDGGTCDIVIDTTVAACNACLNAGCCTEVNDCFGNADCKAFDDCLKPCDAKDAAAGPNDAGSEQKACIQACAQAHQASVNTWLTFATCLDDKCQTGGGGVCQ